jgi:hypothetical protein
MYTYLRIKYTIALFFCVLRMALGFGKVDVECVYNFSIHFISFFLKFHQKIIKNFKKK